MKLSVMILIVAGMILSSRVFAATIRVPSEQPTIQAGIDAALDGDTVLVADGTYTGDGNWDIDFNGKAITVASENGAESCIIDCQGTETENHRGFTFTKGEEKFSILQGFTIQNGYLNNNFISDKGGGIYCYGSSPKITECIISTNKADIGGGIYCFNSSPTISCCSVLNNQAADGGGIYHIKCSYSLEIVNCSIYNNHASMHGGGIWCTSSLNVSNCSITNNTADSEGGGIWCSASLNMTDCSISSNIADYSGGGIFLQNNYSSTITYCAITNNATARGCGGGIFCDESSPKFFRCSITNNTCLYVGGGIRCDNSSIQLTACMIADNMADEGSGGIYCYDSHPRIMNCIISKNTTAGAGGGIGSNNHSFPRIMNSIISGNAAGTFGGGIYVSDFSDAYIYNCIIWGDAPDEIISINTESVMYSDVHGAYPGIGNTDTDPLFLGGDPFDFHLSPNSPCIDAGTDNGAPTTDFDGNPRPQGGAVDMGAYECQDWPSRTRAYITMPSHSFSPGAPASCTAKVWVHGAQPLPDGHLFVVLDVYGNYYCAPSYTDNDSYTRDFPFGLTELTVLPEFTWPSNCGSASDIVWYAFLTNPEMTALASEIGVYDFGWSE